MNEHEATAATIPMREGNGRHLQRTAETEAQTRSWSPKGEEEEKNRGEVRQLSGCAVLAARGDGEGRKATAVRISMGKAQPQRKKQHRTVLGVSRAILLLTTLKKLETTINRLVHGLMFETN